MWNEDEVDGKGKEIKGNIKEKVGQVTGNRNLEGEGQADQVEGKVQKNVGKARRKVGEVIEDIGEKISH